MGSVSTKSINKTEVLSKRFEVYFDLHQINVNGQEADVIFRDELANAPIKYFMNTVETLSMLKNTHDLYIVTNGVLETQQRRIAKQKWEIGLKVCLYLSKLDIKTYARIFDFVLIKSVMTKELMQ